LEAASLFVIQNGPKNAGRIEVRVAVPIDRTVHAYQSNSPHVADDSVIFDRLIGHYFVPSLSENSLPSIQVNLGLYGHAGAQLIQVALIRVEAYPQRQAPYLVRIRYWYK
jgi:hypothetical protein